GGDGRRAPVAGQRGGPGEAGSHVRVGAGGRQGEAPGAFDRVGGGRGQRGVHGPPFVHRGLRVQRRRDQRVREPQRRVLRVGRQQPQRGGLRGLRLGLVTSGRVQQRQRGPRARAG